MLIAMLGVKLYALSYTWMLIAKNGVKLYAHYCIWSEALCSLLYKK